MQDQEQPPAQTEVLTTPELLEIILLHLDTRTLLVSAQRVCQTWTALIQSSSAIQQALFFQETIPKKEKWDAKSTWNSIRPSPLKKDTKLDQGSVNEYDLRPIYNPLLVQAFRLFFPSVHEYPPIDDNDEKKAAYMRKEASWRKMLLRQPPVRGGITVFKMYHAMGGDSHTCYKVPGSLKMGHFLTTLTQNPDLYFGEFGQTQIYWSAYVPPYKPDDSYPPQGGSFYTTVIKAFATAIEESELVVFSREVIQCSVGEERELTEDEKLRDEIAEAETKGSKGGEE